MVIRKTICRKSVYTHKLIDDRLMSMRIEVTVESVAINLVVAIYPNGGQPQHTAERGVLEEVGTYIRTDSNEGMSVRTGRRKRADSKEDGRV